MNSVFLNDIKKLNALYKRIQFSFVFLYGRPETGKTRLVREFCYDKKTFFFSAQEMVAQQQLLTFWKEAVRSLKPTKTPAPFTTWTEAFTFIADYSFTHRLVFVLDEFHKLAQLDPFFLTAFTDAVAHSFQMGKVFLILTSSSVSYAEEIMTDPVCAPFDAVTARAHLTSLPFYACQERLAGFLPEEQLLLYGVTGGFPAILSLLNLNHTAAENIRALFFQNQAPLFMRPQVYMHQELREVSTYNFLLQIIAEGAFKLVDIAGKASIGTNKCAKYLNILISMGILKKEYPAVGEIQKKVRYVFTDHMLRFWYRFVYPNISGILFGNGDDIWYQEVVPQLNEYLLPVFEDLSAEYLQRLTSTGQAGFSYQNAGSWWSGGTKRESFFRIPMVAADSSHTVLGTCHCGSSPAERSYLDGLLQPLEPFDHKERYCCIFSTSGFTEELRSLSKSTPNIWLIDLEDICGS